MFGKLKQSVYKVHIYGEHDKSGENRSNVQQLAQCLHTTEYGTVHSYVQCSIFEIQCTKHTVVNGSTVIVCKLSNVMYMYYKMCCNHGDTSVCFGSLTEDKKSAPPPPPPPPPRVCPVPENAFTLDPLLGLFSNHFTDSILSLSVCVCEREPFIFIHVCYY